MCPLSPTLTIITCLLVLYLSSWWLKLSLDCSADISQCWLQNSYRLEFAQYRTSQKNMNKFTCDFLLGTSPILEFQLVIIWVSCWAKKTPMKSTIFRCPEHRIMRCPEWVRNTFTLSMPRREQSITKSAILLLSQNTPFCFCHILRHFSLSQNPPFCLSQNPPFCFVTKLVICFCHKIRHFVFVTYSTQPFCLCHKIRHFVFVTKSVFFVLSQIRHFFCPKSANFVFITKSESANLFLS